VGNLKKGKSIVQAVIKEELVKKLDEIAEKELTSRSNIAGKIIHENIEKYITNKKEDK
jgi:metal-responsive CopG/Arc/MetJ family transcriptional regulator